MAMQLTLLNDHPDSAPAWSRIHDPATHWQDWVAAAPPTSIVVLVSGGIDSDAVAVWARTQWPATPLILLHCLLDQMDWPHTPAHLDRLTVALAPARLHTIQAVYERTGAQTPGGYAALRTRRIHDVTTHGPAADADPAVVRTLLQLVEARNNLPPTSSLRYCTAYLKSQPTDAWLRANRAMLGARPLLLSGERWAESRQRSHVARAEWRVSTKQHAVLWARPCIDWSLDQVTQVVLAAGLPPHPAYALQGMPPDAMEHPRTTERGRPRLSCRICIFSHARHIRAALDADPASMADAVAAITDFEATTGRTWQQRGPLDLA